MRARKIVRGLREGFMEAERYAVAYHVVCQLKERAFLGTCIEIGQVSAREIVGRPRELGMRPREMDVARRRRLGWLQCFS